MLKALLSQFIGRHTFTTTIMATAPPAKRLEAGKSRGSFSGKLGYVLAVAGSAVGLGNIWRFPYLAAKYGGGIFLLVYLELMLTFGYALIVSETALGRMTKRSPVGESVNILKNTTTIHNSGTISAISQRKML